MSDPETITEVEHMAPRCHAHVERDATTRVWWTHEGKKRTALLCDECFARIADLVTDARRLNPEEVGA